jgi:UDP-N-acetylglucosamine--N-acetylmuramyl-(pentapeptide) pyrophosphoryl-undecaprenol N-acetylglucosamine transferase
MANTVIEAFAGSFKAKTNAVCTGNPLRKSLLTLNTEKNWHAAREFRILIIGGSQGAAFLNSALPSALAQLRHVAIKHQTGAAMQAEVTAQYQRLKVDADVTAFINDMEAAYTWADMLICRSGAMTISELAAAGLPAILVPLPNAIDNHQLANAKVLADAGAAIIAEQYSITDNSLIRDIQTIQEHYSTMANQAKSIARLDATERVAELCTLQAKS